MKQRDLDKLQAEGRAESVRRHVGVLASLGEVHMYRGNLARLLVDGPQTFAAMKVAVAKARQRVLLETYIIEGDGVVIQALSDAARRGVEVVLVLPGRSDVKLVMHAARSYYAQLLDAGVQVYEMKHAVVHAETAVIDGVFASVGSSNLDWRSIVGNKEIDVIVLGDDFGRELEGLFSHDVASSTRIDHEQWRGRGVIQRLLEGFGRLVEPLL